MSNSNSSGVSNNPQEGKLLSNDNPLKVEATALNNTNTNNYKEEIGAINESTTTTNNSDNNTTKKSNKANNNGKGNGKDKQNTNTNSKFNIGPDGVAQIYPDAKEEGKSQVYMKDNPAKDIFNVSYGNNSHIPYKKKTQGSLTFFNTEGSKINYHSGNKSGRSVRIDTYPGKGMWKNNTKYYWKNNPGYLYTDKGIKNGEFTTFIRVHNDLGTHQAYAHKIGGRDQDALRSLIEMVYPTSSHGDVTINYNYAHFPYVKAKPKILKKVSALKEGKWVGVKTIHIVGKDSTHWEMWADEDPIASDGSINNNWVKIAEYKDEGCDGYGNQPLNWACHKDVCRVDGFGSVDFALFSDREIDPNAKPNVTTNPAKPISEQGDKPEQDDSEDDNSVEEVQEAEQWVKDNPQDALKVLEGLPQLNKDKNKEE